MTVDERLPVQNLLPAQHLWQGDAAGAHDAAYRAESARAIGGPVE